MTFALWICGLSAVALMLAGGVVTAAPARTGAAVEFQTGPVILALAASEGPVRLVAQTDCMKARCPLIEMRVRRGDAPESRVRLKVD